jgi:poly(glycerol-phosphate) alpha-glucosyltransferase
MVILDAWTYAKPVLMTPQCNLPEGFAAGAAIRIETDPESIARGLASLVAMSAQDRLAMGQRGFALVHERFSWPRIALQMQGVYLWMLGQGPRPDCMFND